MRLLRLSVLDLGMFNVYHFLKQIATHNFMAVPHVLEILSEANEKFNRKYELKRLGYNLEKVEHKVADIFHMEREELYEKGRQKRRAEARSLLFYWSVRELGLIGTFLAERFGMSQPGFVYAVYKGEKIAKENGYRLPE